METEDDWAYREFTLTGKVYSPSDSIAEYRVYWSVRNSELDEEIIINKIEIGGK